MQINATHILITLINQSTPTFLICNLCIAALSAKLLQKIWGPIDSYPRNSPLDGIRGYLGLSVFTNHSLVWYYRVQSGGGWSPTVGIYENAAKSSVLLFFAITAYLFISKITSSKSIDWSRLYISRITRLYPLYLIAIFILFTLALIKTNFQIESPANLAIDTFYWTTSSLFGCTHPINGLLDAFTLTSAAYWNLKYEWLFYLSLPIIALIIRRSTSFTPIIFSFAALLTRY